VIHPTTDSATPQQTRGRLLLALAAVAVAFAAADTYVVVLALPDMMAGVGLSVEELQRGAPVVSGFLLGYVAMLPLIGRIADLRGRLPVLVAGLCVFAAGSLLTAVAYDLPSMVVGRFFQGLGGGALVPATLALVADLYPVHRRGVPLGVVSAVQELGSVLGPLLGAVVLSLADWRAIFLLNLAVGLVLAAAVFSVGRAAPPVGPAAPPVGRAASASERVETNTVDSVGLDTGHSVSGLDQRKPTPGLDRRSGSDPLGLVLLAVLVLAVALVLWQPTGLVQDLRWGQLFVSYTGTSRWVTPLGVVAVVSVLLLALRLVTAERPLLDVRDWWRLAREVDVLGSFLMAVALGGVILAFATADPAVQVFSAQGRWYLAAAGIAAVALAIHLATARDPLVPARALRARPAWGSVVVSFFVGAALVAALIDIPLFAHTTTHGGDDLGAALVLLRYLVALPVGAVAGGYLTRRVPAGAITAAGMLLAAAGFVWMTQWQADALESWVATVPLVVGGLGFGLALAPVNAAVLATTAHDVHGVASSLVVVARMVGMLVGISALTTLGLRRYYAEQDALPALGEVCDDGRVCGAYEELLRGAAIAQEHTVFAGAAVAAVAAGVLALLLFRGAPTRETGATPLSLGLG